MNATELATKMLEWETTQRAADALRAEIEAAVYALGKTQTVGNVRATFSAGRKTYDYRGAWMVFANGAEPGADFEKVTYDYRAACAANDLEARFTQSEPSVSVKLLAS